jgi:hypothetical protein
LETFPFNFSNLHLPVLLLSVKYMLTKTSISAFCATKYCFYLNVCTLFWGNEDVRITSSLNTSKELCFTYEYVYDKISSNNHLTLSLSVYNNASYIFTHIIAPSTLPDSICGPCTPMFVYTKTFAIQSWKRVI